MKKTYFALATLAIVACSAEHGKPTPPQPIAATSAAVAIRNLREYPELLSRATGLTVSKTKNPKILAYFEATKTAFSASGDATQLSAATLLATLRLAGLFCSAFVDAEAALPAATRKAHRIVDFSSVEALRGAAATAVATRYAELFWRRAPTATETETIAQAMRDVAGLSMKATTQVKQGLVAGCTIAASSLDAIQL